MNDKSGICWQSTRKTMIFISVLKKPIKEQRNRLNVLLYPPRHFDVMTQNFPFFTVESTCKGIQKMFSGVLLYTFIDMYTTNIHVFMCTTSTWWKGKIRPFFLFLNTYLKENMVVEVWYEHCSLSKLDYELIVSQSKKNVYFYYAIVVCIVQNFTFNK